MEENMINPETPESTAPDQPIPPSPTYTYVEPPKYTFPMGKTELVCGILLLLFSMVMCNGLLFAGPNLAFAIGTLGIMGSSFGYLLLKKHRPDGYTIILMILSVVLAATIPRSDDDGLKFLITCTLLVVPSLALCLTAGQNRRKPSGFLSLLDAPRTLFGFGVGRITESARGIRVACSSSGAIGKKGSAVILGLLIAIPLLAVMVPLLMFADAAFEGLLDLLPEFQWGEVLTTAVLGFGIGYILYTRNVTLQYLPKSEVSPGTRKGLNPITVNTVLVCVAVVYVTYLFSQLAYFVGGFSGILPQGYTMAEYARRGFFEMATLCTINLSIIAFSVGLVSGDGKAPLATRLICLFIGLVTLFLVTAASAKMFLYIGSFGLTRLRVLTEVFMLWLAFTTVLVCIWLFREKTAYMKGAVIAALALCTVLVWTDVDTVVARYNVRAYQSGQLETVDVSHLGSLSCSAVPYLQELTQDENPEIAQKATDILNRKARFMYEDEDLRSWNYEKMRATEILKTYQKTEKAER